MSKMLILYIIAGLNGATLLTAIAGTIEVFKTKKNK